MPLDRNVDDLAGASIVPRHGFEDARGALIEVHQRSEGLPDISQWTAFTNAPASLRGMHVHAHKTDTLIVVSGHLFVGLVDLRGGEPTHLDRAVLELSAAQPELLVVPDGVAHAFVALEPCVYIVGTTLEYDPADDFGCRFDDPGVGIDWPITEPLLSERDANAGSFAEMTAWYEAR